MKPLLAELRKRLPGIVFKPGEQFFWSPESATVSYRPDETESGSWTLLHEAAHAALGHASYYHDLDLLLLEVAAWQKAKELATELGIGIDEDHIQDSLDTYRDWLHQRSTCPQCGTVSLQVTAQEYNCHNCSGAWSVSPSRFCRPYRLRALPTKRSLELTRATFH